MSILKKDKKFQSLLIALFSFFIFVFFTTGIYWDMQINLDENKVKTEKLKELNKDLDNLNQLKIDLEDKNNENSKKVKKFVWDFSEDKIILYINDYIEKVNNIGENKDLSLLLDSISFSEEKKSELWFNQIDINLNMKISDKYSLINLLDYLVSDWNEYSFFITDLSFDIEKSGPYKISIPLKMYIK